jgi:hypothetical protein
MGAKAPESRPNYFDADMTDTFVANDVPFSANGQRSANGPRPSNPPSPQVGSQVPKGPAAPPPKKK